MGMQNENEEVEMIKIFQIGSYIQKMEFNEEEVSDITCTCMWATIHPNNYKDGLKCCKHIKELLNEK